MKNKEYCDKKCLGFVTDCMADSKGRLYCCHRHKSYDIYNQVWIKNNYLIDSIILFVNNFCDLYLRYLNKGNNEKQ